MAEEEEKDDWLEDVDDEADGESELDQSDIDSLLSEDEEPAASADSDVDQSDIDSLLAGDDGNDEVPDTPPSQDEIDQLFSEVDDDAPEDAAAAESTDDDPFKAEEIDFKDLAEDSDDDDFGLDDIGDGFDTEEFGLDDDTPDIPDISEDGDDAPTVLAEGAASSGNEDETVFLTPDQQAAAPGSKRGLPMTIPPFLQNRKIQAIIGGSLVLIIVAFFLLKGKPVPKKPIIAKQPPSQAQPVSTAPVTSTSVSPVVTKTNTTPQVKDSELTIARGDNELAIKLNASDAENDPLNYEILSLPEHGKLSGQAPNLIYLPNKNFAGQDNLMFRVSDGHNVSAPATIKIMWPAAPSTPTTEIASQAPAPSTPVSATPQPAPVLKEEKPVAASRSRTVRHKKLVIAARNETYHLTSSKPFRINWQKLWSKANYLPYTSKIRVEIISANLHGKLHKTNARSYRYAPDKFFAGTEQIKYRFRLAKLRSKIGKIKLKIAPGHPAPDIHLAEISPSYLAGERVVLDASASRDDDRSSLLFSWKQIAGVPVQIEPTNAEGSQITFVAPSSFNTVNNPGPVLRLTITDRDNQKDSRDLKINTRSRRHSAIWDGVAAGGE